MNTLDLIQHTPRHPGLQTLAMAIFSADLEPIRISEDGGHFIMKDSGTRFTPWGLNFLATPPLI